MWNLLIQTLLLKFLLFAILASGAIRLGDYESGSFLYNHAFSLADIPRQWRTHYITTNLNNNQNDTRYHRDTNDSNHNYDFEEELRELKIDETLSMGLLLLTSSLFLLCETQQYLHQILASLLEAAEQLMKRWLRFSRHFNVPVPQGSRNLIVYGFSSVCFCVPDEDRAHYQELVLECLSETNQR